jgi:hypothetical protein
MDLWGQQLPEDDILGTSRVVNGNVDIGACEYEALGVLTGRNKPQAASCKLQVYPNPSFGISYIRYNLPVNRQLSTVNLLVYDMMGKQIMTLVNTRQLPGEYKVCFDGSDLQAGIYLVRLETGGYVETSKLLIMK